MQPTKLCWPLTRFQSTRPVKDATIQTYKQEAALAVSIHASREGRDTTAPEANDPATVSIHASREGRDC